MNDQFNGTINAQGGRGGDSFGNGRGGDGGNGGSVAFIKVSCEISDLKNPHRDYWQYIFNLISNFCKSHKKTVLALFISLVLLILYFLGYLNWKPEIQTWIGTFSLNEIKSSDESKSLPKEGSRTLDISVFDLTEKVYKEELTSLGKVNRIKNISGLSTKEELGSVSDIGTDGLTLLIEGNVAEGSTAYTICDFSTDWFARLSLLKKDSEVKFRGVVESYDLSRYMIKLKECELIM